MANRFKSILFKITIIGLIILFLVPLCLWSGRVLIVNDSHPPKSDVIIVLGCPAQDDGQPSPTMKARVEKAVELFHEGYAPTIIFSGASVSNKFVEAEVMANYAESLGVPKSAVIVETEARDTIQNTKNSVEMMHENNWRMAIIVTSPYHTKRVSELFSKLDVQASIVAAEHPPEMSLYNHLGAILREYFLMLWYRVSGENLSE